MAILMPSSTTRTALEMDAVIRKYKPVGNASYTSRLICVAALVSADLVAFLLSMLVAALFADQNGAELGEQVRIAVTVDVVLLAGVMMYFIGQDHYTRRVRRLPEATQRLMLLAAKLRERLADGLSDREVFLGELGAVLGAHVGPGMVAVSVSVRS